MSVFDLYSKRQKRIRGEVPDVYSYDDLPAPLRIQIIHIWKDLLGDEHKSKSYNGAESLYDVIVTTLRREYGVFELIAPPQFSRQSIPEELYSFILNESDVERCMDTIEISFRIANNLCRSHNYRGNYDASTHTDRCIDELNQRFMEQGVGYQFINDEIIRIDSQLIHNEAVKPALTLLNRTGFEGPRDEFLAAYEHFRHKNYKESLNDALKSFESMMKVICSTHSWQYDSKDAAKKLINVCTTNGLFPNYYQNHLTALATLLESSVPTIRNKESGHGQGGNITNIEPAIVAYTLHMTASAIVMLGELGSHRSD